MLGGEMAEIFNGRRKIKYKQVTCLPKLPNHLQIQLKENQINLHTEIKCLVAGSLYGPTVN